MRAQLKTDELSSELKPGNAFVTIVESNTLSATGYEGGLFSPTSDVCTISNSFGSSITWTAEVYETWLQLSPASGVLAPGATTQFAVNLSAGVSNQAAGNYSTDLLVINTANGISTRRVATLAVKSVATLPFVETFETGQIEPWWTTTGTAEWRTEVISTFNPHGGSYHLGLDDLASGGLYSRNEATLEIDLTGYSNIVLTFWAQDIGDESHFAPATPFLGANFDGVAISEDGTNWYDIVELTALANTNYAEFVIDLDAATFGHGLNYSSRFKIRFNHYDNFSMNVAMGSSDGLTFDDISVIGTLMDSDGDGMPDNYENAYALNATNAGDAILDPDDDGASNLAEYRADTHPGNSSSVFVISSLISTNDSRTLFWPSSANRTYSLEYTPEMVPTNWTVLATNIIGTGSAISLADTNAAPRRFYRVLTTVP